MAASVGKRIVWIIATLGVVVGLAVAAKFVFFAKKPPTQFETAKATKGHLVAKVTATGTLSALVTVQVGAQVSGRISALHADWNSEVKKDQLIAEIDPELFKAAVLQAQANLAQAIGQLKKSQALMENYKVVAERDKELNKQGLLAQQDYEAAVANYNSQKGDVAAQQGNIEQAKAQLITAEVNLKYTRIISPVDGTVISRAVDVGQSVAASLAIATLFTIAEDLRKMQVDTNVAEGDVGKLQSDMKATFLVDAFPGEPFKGNVRQIRNAAVNVQNVITYDAVLDVDNSDLRLRPGMTANVTFVYAEKDDVLMVPNAALRFRPPPELVNGGGGHHRGGGAIPSANAATSASTEEDIAGNKDEHYKLTHRAVWVSQGPGQLKRVKVKTGITDGTSTEILEGELQPNDEVILDIASGGPKPAATANSNGPPQGRMPRMP
jgi:HlyD family secretion protein